MQMGTFLPVDVVVLVHAVELQFEATEQVLDHDPQVVVEDPCAQTGQVLPLGLQLHEQAVQRSVHLLRLHKETEAETTV